MTDVWPFVAGIVGVVSGAVGTWIAMRKEQREARNQVIVEADQTISLLKEQNEILRVSLANADERESEWRKREARLEGRIAELEREYRTLVKTISTMGLCSDPTNCAAFKAVKSS